MKNQENTNEIRKNVTSSYNTQTSVVIRSQTRMAAATSASTDRH